MKKWFKGPVVEDSAMECVNALNLKRINELEEENYKLKRENKILRYEALPSLEKEWAERAWRVVNGSSIFDKSFDDFRCSYMDRVEMENTHLEDLPFYD